MNRKILSQTNDHIVYLVHDCISRLRYSKRYSEFILIFNYLKGLLDGARVRYKYNFTMKHNTLFKSISIRLSSTCEYMTIIKYTQDDDNKFVFGVYERSL